jgi:hypothetical protein
MSSADADAESGLQEYHATCTELVEADDRRDIEIDRLSNQFRINEFGAHGDRMAEIAASARRQLMALPAPDAKAALWKFDCLIGDDGNGYSSGWDMDHETVKTMISDVRRFIGGEA